MKFKITKGKVKHAIRLTCYGAEGIGKSTFASKFPDPLFIDIEEGTKTLDVARLPKPDTWAMLLAEIDAVIEEPECCRTLVIDTIDRAEALLTIALLEEGKCDSIEKYGGGYGKGYTALQERFSKDLLTRLDKLIAKGVNVTLLGHAQMRKLESPDDPPYDRWELKVSKKVAPIVKEWSDILLFTNYEVMVVEENGKNKAKGVAQRYMYANHKPTYDAKNRYGLPDRMKLDFSEIKQIYDGIVEPQKQHTELAIDTPTSVPVEEPVEEDIRDILVRWLADRGVSEDRLNQWLVSSARVQEGETYMHLSDATVRTMINHIDQMAKVIGGKK